MKSFIFKFFALSIISFLIVASALFFIDSKKNGFSTLILQQETTVVQNTGHTIQLTFTAGENYLGTVGLFLTSPKKGNITFALKEKESKNWYYENKFSTEQFNILSPYPLGFPVIQTSKGKEYVIQIQTQDAAQIYLTKQNIESRFVFPKESITKSKTILLTYIFKKYYYILLGTPIFLYTLVFVFVLLKPQLTFRCLKYLFRKILEFSNLIPITLFIILAISLLTHNLAVSRSVNDLLWIFFAAAILYGCILWINAYFVKKSEKDIKKIIINIFACLTILALLLGAIQKDYILGGDDSRVFYLYPLDYFLNYATKAGPDTAVSSLVSLLPPVSIAPFILLFVVLKTIFIGINLQMFLYTLNIVGGIVFFYMLLDYIYPNKKLSGFIAKGLASLMYVFSIFNFYTLFNSQLIAIYLISTFPLSMYLYIRGIRESKIYLLATCALIWSIFSYIIVALPWFAAAFLGFFPVLVYLFWKHKKKFVLYNLIFMTFLLLLNCYWLFAVSYSSVASNNVSQSSAISSVNYRNENALGIRATSEINKVFFPLLNLYHYNIQSNFNWPYLPIYNSWYLMLLPLNSIFIFMILITGAKIKRGSLRRLYIATATSFLVSIYFFTVNIGSEGIKLFLFLSDTIPGFVMFRNMYDKFGFSLAISFALIIFVCLISFFNEEKRLHVKKIVGFLLFGVILLNAKPFLFNEFYSLPIWTTNNTFNTITGFNQDYLNLTQYIKNNPNPSRYLWVPLNRGNISQIQDPKETNHYYSGVSPLLFLSGKNDYSGITSFEGYSGEINKLILKKDYADLGALYQKFNVRYIIVNHTITSDIKQSYICNEDLCDSQDKQYEKAIEGKKIRDFGSRYSLYEINPKYANDKISLQGKSGKISYKKINSDLYTIQLSHVSKNIRLILLDTYFSNWQITSKDNFPIKGSNHSKLYNYANAWDINTDVMKSELPRSEYIENVDGTINMTLTVKFQRYIYYQIFIFVSVATYIIISVYVLRIFVLHIFRKGKNEKAT